MNCYDEHRNPISETDALLVRRSRGQYYLGRRQIFVKYAEPKAWIVWSTTGQMGVSGRHIGVSHNGQNVFLFHPDTPLGGYRERGNAEELVRSAPEWARDAIRAAWPELGYLLD